MNHSHCPECLNLDYNLFKTAETFWGGYDISGFDQVTRYRVVEFERVRSGASRGCPYCDILISGCKLFWGIRPEDPPDDIPYPDSRGFVLGLRLDPSHGLYAFRKRREYSTGLGWFPNALQIQFFKDQSNEPSHPAFRHARHVPRKLSSISATKALLSWLQQCIETHTGCKTSVRKLPSRIIDISGDVPKLVEFEPHEVRYANYATISHCWGKGKVERPTSTTKKTLRLRKSGIPVQELTPLFRDAIELCKKVDCDYIWIDSLCIVQDDESDWRSKSQDMAAIYSNAYFNIAATSSPNGAHRLFRERWSHGDSWSRTRHDMKTYKLDASSATIDPVYLRQAHSRDHYFIQGDSLNGRETQAPLLGRAWVLQEMLLSRRIIHFCSSELIWECDTLHDCECGSFDLNGLNPPNYKQQLTRILNRECSDKNIYDFWLHTCSRYSQLSLTITSDRLVALAGLARAIKTVTKSMYFWGAWNEDLPRSLLWTTQHDPEHRASMIENVPTWSWMSRLDQRDNTCFCTFSTVLDRGFCRDPRMSVTMLGKETLVEENWSMRISFCGPIVRGTVREAGNNIFGEKFVVESTSQSNLNFSIRFFADYPESSKGALRGRDEAECLLLGTDKHKEAGYEYVLVVKKCDWIPGEVYQRMGIAYSLHPIKASNFSEAEIRKIELI
ncbi:heterokaryon incompatibility protein-domain-containing protein [Xylaria venustula]|nr:heterokaryon incompatibility protein-domain-containing protein [Xylaria venustula]